MRTVGDGEQRAKTRIDVDRPMRSGRSRKEEAMAKVTTEHETIREWVEARGGCPAHVKGTGRDGGDPGILRVDFPGYSGKQSLERIGWDEFFAAFDQNGLAFIYQDRTRGGQPSRFSKLVSRDTVGARGRKGASAASQENASATEPDAISLLTEQHREVEELLDQLTRQSPRSAQFRRTFDELADALAIHATIEEKLFYPSVKTEGTEDLLEESVDDHLEVKRVLATMMDIHADGDIFAELEELGGLTEEHLIEEEHELFPKVRKQMDAATLRQLGARMTEMVEELRREGSPRMRVPEETNEAAPI
jgi:hemerythrin superfamily protein